MSIKLQQRRPASYFGPPLPENSKYASAADKITIAISKPKIDL